MPEDIKKNADKKKNDPKEQRKPRHPRNQVSKTDRKADKTEETKAAHKVSAPQQPVYKDPGPEFYQNLKRETEEIVKITEAENAKYKKKEIQSNWAKYEMPIASYEDVDEQDVGADYEKLIQAPLSSGGHFQFKHEKSWDTSTAPSLYDKYFEINMENLSSAISTVPFYERNDIDKSLFSESDLISMNNRASKYKLKYFNDKTYSTPEMDAQDRILKGLCLKEKTRSTTEYDKISKENVRSDEYDVDLDFNITKTDNVAPLKDIDQNSKHKRSDSVNDFDDEFIFKDELQLKSIISESEAKIQKAEESNTVPTQRPDVPNNTALKVMKNLSQQTLQQEFTTAETKLKKGAVTQEQPVASKVNTVIESPEDLEKWLDDFLDS